MRGRKTSREPEAVAESLPPPVSPSSVVVDNHGNRMAFPSLRAVIEHGRSVVEVDLWDRLSAVDDVARAIGAGTLSTRR